MEQRRQHRQEFGPADIRLPGAVLFGYNLSTRAEAPLQPHSHSHCAEVVLVVRGEQLYSVDQGVFTAAPGTAFVTAPGQLHQNGGSYSSVSEFFWLQLDVRAEHFLGLAAPYGELLRQAVLDCREHLIPIDPSVLATAKQCHSALAEGADPVRLAGLFCSMAAGIFLERAQNDRRDNLMQRVREFIEAHIEEELPLAQLTARFGLSESGLQHRFRQETGESLRSYINQRRIERAKQLLESGMSVTETAMRLNFSSSDYFSTVFRRYTSVPPTGWIS